MLSHGLFHTDKQVLDDQQELIHNSYVQIQDVTWKTCRKWLTIEMNGEKGWGISVLATGYNDDLTGELLSEWQQFSSGLQDYSQYSSYLDTVFCTIPISKPLEIPSAPITIGITVTFMFYSFFSALARSKYKSIILFSFIFTLWSSGMAKFMRWQVDYYLIIIHFF